MITLKMKYLVPAVALLSMLSANPVLAGTKVVASGSGHSLVIKSDGSVWGWGANSRGELGDGTTVAVQSSPVRAIASGARDIAANNGSSYVLKADGTLWSYGYNASGQLGIGGYVNQLVPQQITTLTNVVAVAADSVSALALRSDGTVWTWGPGSSGQLGNGTFITKSPTPVQVVNLTNVVAIAAGGSTAHFALKDDGTVWAWGSNASYTLGVSDSTFKSAVPIQVNGLSGIIAIAASGIHAIALKSDGTVWTWGKNELGALGTSSETYRYIPAPVVNLTTIKAIVAGSAATAALDTNGDLWSWGKNSNCGQIGDGTQTDRYAPVKTSLTGITQVSAGSCRRLAIGNDGTVWRWGAADGFYGATLSPVPVQGLTP